MRIGEGQRFKRQPARVDERLGLLDFATEAREHARNRRQQIGPVASDYGHTPRPFHVIQAYRGMTCFDKAARQRRVSFDLGRRMGFQVTRREAFDKFRVGLRRR